MPRLFELRAVAQCVTLTVLISLVDKCANVGCHLALNIIAGAKMSLALLILYAELMTVMRVVHFHFAASRYRETLGRSLVCLDFSHNFVLLCIVNDLTYYIIKGN